MNYKKSIIAFFFATPIISYAANMHDIDLSQNKGIEIVTTLEVDLGTSYFDDNYPKVLLGIEQREKGSLMNASYQSDPYDTHLKHNISQIKLVYKFKPIPNIDSANVIGFAPIGTWKNDGWTGVKEFFKDKDLGTCEYINSHLISMQIDRSVVRDDVNGKMTTISTDGNDKSGYLYNVSWYEEGKNREITEHQINCANMKHDSSINEKIVILAKSIDNN